MPSKAKRPAFFKEKFDELAAGTGFIGDPNGKLAYAYLRVSSDEQAEEGRSGLPRQIKHCHEIAQEKGFKVPWELVYAEDYSGFELDRPELDQLRKAYKHSGRRANAVVIEHLDRLSRNADWHQGYLLEEMRNHSMAYIFWKPLGSRIERAVQGAVSQEGMEQAKERMRDGLRSKQQDGRITAKFPALGYRFVDSHGRSGTKEVSKMTYYAIDQERAVCIEFIFDELAYRGATAYKLNEVLNEKAAIDPRFKPPRGDIWGEQTVSRIVKNPLYQGQFISNRHYKAVETVYLENGDIKKISLMKEKPCEEWIYTPVPAIVSKEVWELANANLYKNKLTSNRNAKSEYLLSRLLKCDSCGRTYRGQTIGARPDRNQPHDCVRYQCGRSALSTAERAQRPCTQPGIVARKLDAAVWDVITEWLLNPDTVAAAIEKRYSGEDVQAVWDQIAYIEGQIAGKAIEEDDEHKAYRAHAYTAEEWAEIRQKIKRDMATLQTERQQLRAQLMTPEQLAEKKQAALKMLREIRKADLSNSPFTLKRKIVKLLVDQITVNIREGWFRVDGVVSGGFFALREDATVPVSSHLCRSVA